jgi:(R,R)-butanediol dehydrogenase/meso-butanediol dehydrogenase/diacetyl reductase
MMKALRYYGVNDVRLEEVDMPKIGPGEVLVKVEYSGICGTDRSVMFKPGVASQWIKKAPLTIGHECAGTVFDVKKGSVDATGQVLKEGDLVTVEGGQYCGKCHFCKKGERSVCANVKWLGFSAEYDGAFAEYTKVNASSAHKLVKGLTPRQGALVEPVAIGVHSVRRGNVALSDSVFIYGAGAIGLGILQYAKALGAHPIMISESSKPRREIAKSLGADVTIDPKTVNVVERVREETDHLGADVVFEVVGIPSLQTESLELVRNRGRVVCVGIPDREASIDFNKIVTRELRLIGAIDYTFPAKGAHDFKESMNFMRRGKIRVDPLVTHEFNLADHKKAFEVSADPDKSIKVLFKIGGETK